MRCGKPVTRAAAAATSVEALLAEADSLTVRARRLNSKASTLRRAAKKIIGGRRASPVTSPNSNQGNEMEQSREEFFRTLDGLILAGTPVMQIVNALGIRERSVRRRKAELGRQGHTFKLQGKMSGVEHVGTA